MEELLDILAHGDDAQVAARIYDAESLSDSARQIPLNFLRVLRAPQPGLNLQVVERHPSGRFELAILRVPWREKPGEACSGYHPLLVTEQGGKLRALGYVLPWNEVIPQLQPEMGIIMPFSMVWITRQNALKAGPA